MSRRAAAFTQADAERALRAARAVAPGPWRLRIAKNGEIIVEPTIVAMPEAGGAEPAEVAPEREIVL